MLDHALRTTQRGIMREVVIVAAARTPIGKYAGALRSVRPDDLSAVVLKALVERAKLDPADVEDVMWGCSNQAGEDNRNVARMALLAADFPESVAGATLNRLCGSGLQAINSASHAIASNCGDIFIAGGVESMTRSPYVIPKPETEFARAPQIYDTTLGARMYNPKLTARGYPPLSMGETAENVAERYRITRKEQDEFAYASQHKTGSAQQSGAFDRELIGVTVPGNGKATASQVFIKDEPPRPDVTMEQLAKLKPAFREGGTVTAGNSSGINDGAAGIVMMSAEEAKRRGLRIMARIVTSAVAGVDPNFHGTRTNPSDAEGTRSRQPAHRRHRRHRTQRGFRRAIAGLHPRTRDFRWSAPTSTAARLRSVTRLGCSGARIMVTLLHAMESRGAKRGLATMCIGVGQGISTIVERL